MQLDQVVNRLIYKYPSLFRATTYLDSRMIVLDNMFSQIGTGYEWHPNGYLQQELDDVVEMDALPNDFFDKKLYYIFINPEQVNEFIESMKGKFYYFTDKPLHSQCKEFVFAEEVESKAKSIILQFDQTALRMGESFPIHINALIPNTYLVPTPYNEYSHLYAMINGVDYNKKALPQIKNDWLLGARELAEYCLKFYQNNRRCRKHFMHYTNPSKRNTKKTWEEFCGKQIQFFEKCLIQI